MVGNTENMIWEAKFVLLTNPNIVKAWLKTMCATYLSCILIIGAIFIGTGEIEALPMLALIFLCVISGFTLLGFLIMLVIFGNKSRARFELSGDGVFYESIDKKARLLSRIVVLAGGIVGSPSAAGAGLLSISGEQVSLKWKAVFEARYDKRQNTIRLRNQYRDLLHLYCTPENYDAVAKYVKARISSEDLKSKKGDTRSPLPGALLSTFMVVVSCLPVYALVEIADLHLMIPILIMVFSLAMVWMIPLFAWVTLPLMGYIPVHMIWFLSGESTLKLVSTYTYNKYELVDPGEWIIIGLAAAGIFYLSRISSRSLKGKYVPVLMRDQQGLEKVTSQ